MTIKAELLALMHRIDAALDLPRVRRVYIPEPRPHGAAHTEFGLVELEDGAAGLYYAWLGETQRGMNRRFAEHDLIGRTPLELVHLLEEDDDAARSLGMAAVNAVSQSVFRHAGFRPGAAADSMGALAPEKGDHLGMVGYFPSLVNRLGEAGARVTVIERKTHFASDNERIIISQDIGDLDGCNKVLCTAATLLNDSIDDVLAHATDAETVVVVGPTASFLPDPLFRRNVTAVGGTEILDARAAVQALRNDEGLKEVARRYLIRRDNYPGADALLGEA